MIDWFVIKFNMNFKKYYSNNVLLYFAVMLDIPINERYHNVYCAHKSVNINKYK